VIGVFRFRHKLFLDLYETIASQWEDDLQTSGCIDFEDMLDLAADCVEQGRWESPYQLVMVDEFQDASQARTRLAVSWFEGNINTFLPSVMTGRASTGSRVLICRS